MLNDFSAIYKKLGREGPLLSIKGRHNQISFSKNQDRQSVDNIRTLLSEPAV